MSDYVDKLNEDMLQQFKGLPNTEALLAAIGRQLNELYAFFEQLRLDRFIDTAVGKQLDGIGDILVLTRLEAKKLNLNVTGSGDFNDEDYRKWLKFRITQNTNTATYPEVMAAIRMFWKDEYPLFYSEPAAASILLETGILPYGYDTRALTNAPKIKPAGVTLTILATTQQEFSGEIKIAPAAIDILTTRLSSFRNIEETIMPQCTSRVALTVWRGISRTVLPELE